MKKLILLLVFMCAIAAQNTYAQFVTIPDVKFRNVLQSRYPDCFNVINQLDTICAGNAADTVLAFDFSSVSSIEGVKYFKKLRKLDCNDNELTSLSALPSGLTELWCSGNQLTNMSTFKLPSGLKILYCGYNPLGVLPTLPSGLKVLGCNGIQLTSLPTLPSGLTELYCEDNQFTSLPATLPSSLTKLYCGYNQLTSLPTLPNGLKELHCTSNNLTSLSTLPSSLMILGCDYNQLTSLPTLPSGLTKLYCNHNQIINIPTLPIGLTILGCEDNQLTSLPTLPSGLTSFGCGYNQLTSLPILPSGLKELGCQNNQLTSLPTLPSGLTELYCEYNQLNSLPKLPSGLTKLICNSNPQLSCLSYLSSQLISINISNTKIRCLPNKPQGIANNPLPLCNPTNSNSELCPVFPRLAGYVFNDANNNSVKDAGEIPRVGVKVHIPSKGFVGYSNENGFYEIAVDSLKTYTANITQLPVYYTSAISSHSATFTAYGETVMRDFPLAPQGNIKDFKVSVNNFTAFARPGFPLHFRIKYENIGTIAGNATVKFAHAALYNVDSTSITNSFSGDTLVWNFSNVPAGFTGYINVYGRLSATAVLGSTQNFYASVNQNDVADNVIADNRSNLALVVRGSYDPNDKQGTRTLTPTQVTNGEFIDYTIRFQNTGTDTAFTVVISDVLANNLQVNTLEMIATSHNARTSLKGNIIYFEFLNILLPDSNVNEPRSHGFVKFRIKPKNTLVLGNTVQNKAAIYFDYNAPIITNTVVTTVAIPTGIAEKINNKLEVFPNPLEGEMLTIPNVRGASAKLLTITGQELRSWTNITEQISLQNVAAGMYLLEVSQNGQRRTAKVVVK